jgi:hypothetical protein
MGSPGDTVITPELAERLFLGLFDAYDLIVIEGTGYAVPKNGTIPVFWGASLTEIAWKISEHVTREETVTGEPHDPFLVNVDRALDALTLAWQGEYDELWYHEGSGWGAHHKDASEDENILGRTPDELNARIREDWSRRQGGQQ